MHFGHLISPVLIRQPLITSSPPPCSGIGNQFAILMAQTSESRLAARNRVVRSIYPQARSAAQRAVDPALRRVFDTEDLVQSALGDPEALLHLEGRSRREILAWVTRRVRWKAMSRRRSEMAAKRGGGWERAEVEPDQLLSSAQTPSSIMLEQDARERLRSRMACLPEDERRAFQMHADGQSLEAISEELGYTVSRVRTLLGRAFRALGGLK